MNKTTLDTSKKRRLTTIIKAEMKLTLRKKIFAIKKNYFQSIINLHTLKLASNKSMRAMTMSRYQQIVVLDFFANYSIEIFVKFDVSIF